MNVSVINGVEIEAISACVPENRIDNSLFAKQHFDTDMGPTIRSLGIAERRVVLNRDSTSLDLCVRAAEEIFKTGEIDKEEFGAIVFVTLTPDNIMPNNASCAQHLLGFSIDIASFDINHACSGYIYGLWNAALIAKNMNKKVLLLVGDVNSNYVSPWDRSTGLIFGDAGSATVLSPRRNSHEWCFTFNTDASRRDALKVGIGFRRLPEPEHLEYVTYPDGSKRRSIDMEMDGIGVFSYVVTEVSTLIQDFMDELEVDASEYDNFVLHQANAFMLRNLAHKIKLPLEKMPLSLGKYGNTSSASIALNICSELSSAITNSSLNLLLCGMGAGLSTGIASINMDNCICPGVVEINL